MGMLDLVVGEGCQAKVYFHMPLPNFNRGAFEATLEGFQLNPRSKLSGRLEDSEVVVLEMFSLWQSGMNVPSLINKYKGLNKTIVAIDWSDNLNPWFYDEAIDYFFKRS